MRLLKEIINAWENLLIFVPYYFSMPLLIKTLFSPWKREFWKKTKPGFHPEEILSRWVSNLLSRSIGAFLRFLMIFAGIFLEVMVFIFGLPFLLLLSLLSSIIQLLTSNFQLQPKREKTNLFNKTFSLERLLAIRPLASNWHFGFTPNLDKYAQIHDYLTNDRLSFKHVFLVGREKELNQIKRIFARETENNVLLVGEPGSGRHAIINYLANTMFYHRFVYFDLVSLFKDKKTSPEQRGALEEILQEAKAAGNIVLIFGDFEKYVNFADVWEKFIAGSSLYVLALSTPAAYHQILFPNKTLMKYFTKVDVSPLTREQIFQVLKNRFAQLYPSPTWVKAGQKAQLPRSHFYQPDTRNQILETILEASYQTQVLEGTHQPEAALDLLEEFVVHETYEFHKSHETHINLLNRFLEEKLKVPVGKLKQSEKGKLLVLEKLLHQRVVNQEEAITEIANALRWRRLHLSSKEKPIGSFLFLGPTGVGKTETAKALAAIFFENEKFLLRFDMARFQDKSQINQLIAELAQAVRGQLYAVLLLDEIEKAHHDLLNFFLTIIDEGYFHDQNNNLVPCQNLIIIGTSNAASEFIREKLHTQPTRASQVCDLGVEVINFILKHNIFSPEFINRFDAIIVYKPLSHTHLKQITHMKLEKLRERLQEEHKKTFEITDELLERIVVEGTHPEFGVREIERTIKRLVEDKLIKQLLSSS